MNIILIIILLCRALGSQCWLQKQPGHKLQPHLTAASTWKCDSELRCIKLSCGYSWEGRREGGLISKSYPAWNQPQLKNSNIDYITINYGFSICRHYSHETLGQILLVTEPCPSSWLPAQKSRLIWNIIPETDRVDKTLLHEFMQARDCAVSVLE